jgi:hypothetical protein
MRIDEDAFQIAYDEETHIVAFHGTLRMNDFAEFEKIKKFMREAYDLDSPGLILNFVDLDFMNSAGISMLCKFIFEIKDLSPPKSVSIIGNASILWQQKSFENLRKIWDKLTIRFE